AKGKTNLSAAGNSKTPSQLTKLLFCVEDYIIFAFFATKKSKVPFVTNLYANAEQTLLTREKHQLRIYLCSSGDIFRTKILTTRR
ncbi:MAG: hypothetical protein ACI4W2_08825, partial [Eubacterium sp.]